MVIYGKAPKKGFLVNDDFINIKFRSLQGDYNLTSLNPADLLRFYSSVLPIISGKTCQIEKDLYPFIKRTVRKYTGFKIDKICKVQIIQSNAIHEEERKTVEESKFVKTCYAPLKKKSFSLFGERNEQSDIEQVQPAVSNQPPVMTPNCNNNNSGVAPQETKERSWGAQVTKVAYWKKQHSKGLYERIYIDTTHGNCYLDLNSKRMFNRSFDYDPDMNIIKNKALEFLGFQTEEQLFAFRTVKEGK